MVDTHAITHLSDGLVPGLNYGPAGNTAEYVKASKLVKFRPEAGDRYSPGAAKVIRFRLVDDCWLNSVRLQVTLNNLTRGGTDGNTAVPLSPISPRSRCLRVAAFSWVARLWSRLMKYRLWQKSLIDCNLPTDDTWTL